MTPRTTTGAPPVSGGAAVTSGGHAPHVTATDADTTGVGPIVETAIQRSPILYIRNGSISIVDYFYIFGRLVSLHCTASFFSCCCVAILKCSWLFALTTPKTSPFCPRGDPVRFF